MIAGVEGSLCLSPILPVSKYRDESSERNRVTPHSEAPMVDMVSILVIMVCNENSNLYHELTEVGISGDGAFYCG